MTPGREVDYDVLAAAVDLVARSGGRELEIGYLHDDKPSSRAGWYAHARYQGARIAVEDHPGPVEAAEALARRILTGAKCAHCGGLIALSDQGATAYRTAHLADGTVWTTAQAARADQCRWTRMGSTWVRGCEGDDDQSRPEMPPPQPDLNLIGHLEQSKDFRLDTWRRPEPPQR